MTSTPSPNTLGLDFDHLRIQDLPDPAPSNGEAANQLSVTDATPQLTLQDAQDQPTPDPASPTEKKRPYVNPERVKTGGTQRDKLSEEELVERMARMKEQNEKIKQRRMDVKADEDAFKKTQESERVKLAHTRKVQENVDRTREQNARRKMDKIQSREWDSGKPTGDWKQQNKISVASAAQLVAVSKETKEALAAEAGSSADSPRPDHSGWVRGGIRGVSPRGRGRGRGRGVAEAGGTGPTQRWSQNSPDPASPPVANSTPTTIPSAVAQS